MSEYIYMKEPDTTDITEESKLVYRPAFEVEVGYACSVEPISGFFSEAYPEAFVLEGRTIPAGTVIGMEIINIETDEREPYKGIVTEPFKISNGDFTIRGYTPAIDTSLYYCPDTVITFTIPEHKAWESKITIDTELSDTSENPIQNKAVAEQFAEVNEKLAASSLSANGDGGLYAGTGAISDFNGVSIGKNAYSMTGVAIGANTYENDGGVAIGAYARGTEVGVAVGGNSKAMGEGVAIGSDAKANTMLGIQIGRGTYTGNGLQVKNFELMDENGYIPNDRLVIASPDGTYFKITVTNDGALQAEAI